MLWGSVARGGPSGAPALASAAAEANGTRHDLPTRANGGRGGQRQHLETGEQGLLVSLVSSSGPVEQQRVMHVMCLRPCAPSDHHLRPITAGRAAAGRDRCDLATRPAVRPPAASHLPDRRHPRRGPRSSSSSRPSRHPRCYRRGPSGPSTAGGRRRRDPTWSEGPAAQQVAGAEGGADVTNERGLLQWRGQRPAARGRTRRA
jgi:hypothetical protein